jgi:phosphopantetheinyl transferase
VFSAFNVVLKSDTSGAGPALPGVFATRIPPAVGDSLDFDWLTCEWLTAAEAARAAAIARPQRRAQYVAGRWLLRYAATQVFGEGEYRLHSVAGRPLVAATGGGPAAVSVSHSAELVVCAAGRVQALGVDVEQIRPRADWSALSGWALHPRESERLERAAEAQRWRHFYQAWTFKEALAKALGEGVFGLSFDRIAVSVDGLLEQAPPDARLDGLDWRLRPLFVGEEFAAAVAWRA